jgi:hypothetical protein
MHCLTDPDDESKGAESRYPLIAYYPDDVTTKNGNQGSNFAFKSASLGCRWFFAVLTMASIKDQA